MTRTSNTWYLHYNECAIYVQPSSLAGPPPIKAIAKALVASTEVYTPEEPNVPLNMFYLPRNSDMLNVGVLLGALVVLSHTSDDYLKRQFPPFVLTLRNSIGRNVLRQIWNGLVVIHAGESAFALITCIRRGWYSPLNTFKWTLSTFLFGIGSLSQLRKHANDVLGSK